MGMVSRTLHSKRWRVSWIISHRDHYSSWKTNRNWVAFGKTEILQQKKKKKKNLKPKPYEQWREFVPLIKIENILFFNIECFCDKLECLSLILSKFFWLDNEKQTNIHHQLKRICILLILHILNFIIKLWPIFFLFFVCSFVNKPWWTWRCTISKESD